MFPTSSLSGSIAIPGDATFWMPKPEDIDDDGIGAFFHDTWLIKDVPVREARRLRQQERRIAEAVGHLATTAEDFDRLTHAVEDGYDPPESGNTRRQGEDDLPNSSQPPQAARASHPRDTSRTGINRL